MQLLNKLSVRSFFKYSFLALLMLLPSYKMQSQGLPSLPRDPEITVGSFANGAPYYIVRNTSSKGYADFALVRRSRGDEGELRRALVSLPHFVGRRPADFLAENGVGYGPGGFVQYKEDAEVLRLENVPIYRQEVQDSTLLLLFDVMALSREPQAVIVSGDVDVAKIKERASLFSMIVAPLDKYEYAPERVWTSREDLNFKALGNNSENVAAINLIYSSSRTAREDLNTVLPLVTRLYVAELGEVVRARIRRAFRKADVPLADVRVKYKDSAADSEDERFHLTVYAPASSVERAAYLVGSALGDLDRNGAGAQEFRMAREELASGRKRPARRSNAEGVDKCLAAYLYGADLASVSSANDFYSRRGLSDERDLELFNSYARALLDPSRNLVLRCDVPSFPPDSAGIADSFSRGWNAGYEAASAQKRPIPAVPASEVKNKLRAEAAEPVSGGTMWTFTNGIRVIFKKADTKGEFRYTMMINGGLTAIPSINSGESAFASDMLLLEDIGGLSGEEFLDRLAENGITMASDVSMTSLRISGKAPSDKYKTLFEALLGLTSLERAVNMDSFDYYSRCETLREDLRKLSPRDRTAIMDSLLCPDYFYTGRRTAANLGDGLPQKADSYFSSQFSKINDGVIVLVGDLDADQLKKELPKLVADFKIKKVNTPRPNVEFRMVSGRVNKLEEAAPGLVGGAELGVGSALSAYLPFNLENIMSFRVAEELLRRSVVAAMADEGYCVELESVEETFPRERVTVYVLCRPCRESGLPEDVQVSDRLSAQVRLRETLDSLAETEVNASDLKAIKAGLAADVAAGNQDPLTILDNVSIRFSEGKDMVTGAAAAVESVSADSVKKILESLASGARVEHVVL